jgi:hypothetical protein
MSSPAVSQSVSPVVQCTAEQRSFNQTSHGTAVSGWADGVVYYYGRRSGLGWASWALRGHAENAR